MLVWAVAPESWLWSRGPAEPWMVPALLQAWSLDWWQPRPVGAATLLGTEVTPGGGSPDRFLLEHLCPQSRLCPPLGEGVPLAGSRVWGPGSRVQAQRTGPRRPKPGASDGDKGKEAWGGAGGGQAWSPCSSVARTRGKCLVEERTRRSSQCPGYLPAGVHFACTADRSKSTRNSFLRQAWINADKVNGVGEPGWHNPP